MKKRKKYSIEIKARQIQIYMKGEKKKIMRQMIQVASTGIFRTVFEQASYYYVQIATQMDVIRRARVMTIRQRVTVTKMDQYPMYIVATKIEDYINTIRMCVAMRVEAQFQTIAKQFVFMKSKRMIARRIAMGNRNRRTVKESKRQVIKTIEFKKTAKRMRRQIKQKAAKEIKFRLSV